MYREIKNTITQFFSDNPKQALMITGARQGGKTYIIREYAREHYEHVVEINFYENSDARDLFLNTSSSDDILLQNF